MRFKSNLRRSLAAVSAVTIGAGVLSGLSLLSASPAPAQSSGSVKINGTSLSTANEPHVDCPFTVTFDNFPPVASGDSDLADAKFTVVSPTASLPSYTGTSFDETTSWGPNPPSPQGQITPSVTHLNNLFAGLSNSQLPFHIRLDTTVTDQATNDQIFSKSKTFWVDNACPSVALSKAVDSNGSTVAAGGNTVGYNVTVVVTNATARNVTVTDNLPTDANNWAIDTGAATTFPTGTCSISSGTLTCGPTDLAPGTYTVHITATTPSAGDANCQDTISNTASTSAVFGTVSGSPTNPQRITVTGCTAPQTPAVELSKSPVYPASSTSFTSGSAATFKITADVTNATTSNAKFIVQDGLPTNTGSWSIVGGSDTFGNCAIAAGPPDVLTCDESTTGLGNSPGGVPYEVDVASTTDLTSCSSLANNDDRSTASAGTDLSGSLVASATVTGCNTTVNLSKTADAASVAFGNNVGFTITVNVTGPSSQPATGVDVTDTLPTNVGTWTIASQSANWPNPCTIAAGVLDCSEASLPADPSTNTYTVDVTAPTTATTCVTGTVRNSASLTATSGTVAGSPAQPPDVTVTGCPSGGGGGVVITPPTTGGGGGASFLGVTRIGGTDRIDTADLISQATYASGGAGAVVLARSDLFPDSLAGTPLAVLHHAPILLTPPKYLDPRTAAEIQRVLSHGGPVYLLGQTDALSTTVFNSVKALGYNTLRIGGIDRFATAAAIGNDLGTLNRIFLADGANFPDALTAAAASGTGGTAIILTNGEAMPSVSSAFVAAHPVTKYDIGGPAAGAAPAGATLLVGADRYATSVLVAQTFFSKPTGAGVATGVNFPDALTAGPYLVTLNWPMLLTDPANLPASVSAYLTSIKPSVVAVTVFGGVAAVSANVFNQLVALFS